jgi:hypothetical protein
MKIMFNVWVAVCAAGLATTALPVVAAGSQQGTTVIERTIRVSCYRGPTEATIWDHPAGTFVQDLVDYGYDFADANAIATTTCKDVSLVNDPVRLKAHVEGLIARQVPTN